MTAITESTVQLRARRARHTLRVVYKVSALNLRAQMEYRGNFVASIMFGILWQTSTLMFVSVLLTRFKGGLGGFPSSGVLLIVGMRLVAHGLYVLIFYNFAWIPLLVDEGRMDGYFLRPLPVFMQLLLSQFSVNAIGDLLVGFSTLGVALALVHVHWTVAMGLYVLVAVIAGALVEGAVQLTLSCLLLRSPGSRVLGSWVDELLSTFGNYPLSILPRYCAGTLHVRAAARVRRLLPGRGHPRHRAKARSNIGARALVAGRRIRAVLPRAQVVGIQPAALSLRRRLTAPTARPRSASEYAARYAKPGVGDSARCAAFDDHRNADHLGAGFAQRLHRGEYRTAGRRGVLDGEHSASGHVWSFDASLQTVRLAFLADDECVELAAAGGSGVQHRGRDRVGAEGEPADGIEGEVVGEVEHHRADKWRGHGVECDAAQVDVVVGLAPELNVTLPCTTALAGDLVQQCVAVAHGAGA